MSEPSIGELAAAAVGTLDDRQLVALVLSRRLRPDCHLDIMDAALFARAAHRAGDLGRLLAQKCAALDRIYESGEPPKLAVTISGVSGWVAVGDTGPSDGLILG